MTEREASVRSTLKLALEALETLTDGHSLGGKKLGVEAITAVKEALMSVPDGAQPEQRSVSEHLEPVAYLDEGLGAFYFAKQYKKNVGFTPLYTTPPHCKPLTDEEILQANHLEYKGHDCVHIQVDGYPEGLIAFARAIEAAHGIKE